MNQTFNVQISDSTMKMATIGHDGCDKMFSKWYDGG